MENKMDFFKRMRVDTPAIHGYKETNFDAIKKKLGIDLNNELSERNFVTIKLENGKEVRVNIARIIRDLENITLKAQSDQFYQIWEIIKLLSTELNDARQSDNVRNYPIHVRSIPYEGRTIVQAQLTTEGCNYKKGHYCLECNYGVGTRAFKENEYIRAFQSALKNMKGTVLVLEALGSITDPSEVSRSVFVEIFKLAIESGKFDTILIETHVNFIGDDLIEKISQIKEDVQKRQGRTTNVGFEVGVESMSPMERLLINKAPVSNETLEKTYKKLTERDLILSINLIYGLPFMDESQRVESIMRSINEISSKMPEAGIVIFLMSIKQNTVLEILNNLGLYIPPNPLGLVEVIKHISEDENLKNMIVTLSWFGMHSDNEIPQSLCYDFYKTISEDDYEAFFSNINSTLDPNSRVKIINSFLELLKEKGTPLDKFEKQLKIKPQQGISPLRRLDNAFNYLYTGGIFQIKGRSYRVMRNKGQLQLCEVKKEKGTPNNEAEAR